MTVQIIGWIALGCGVIEFGRAIYYGYAEKDGVDELTCFSIGWLIVAVLALK